MINIKLYTKILFSFLLAFSIHSSAEERIANQIDYSMYFLADIRDAEECSMSYENGKFIFPTTITNPAMTCPDMFSWKLYIDVINDRFWSNWADETQNWPSEPYPLCSQGGKQGVDCCQPGATNNPDGHCPIFPGTVFSESLQKLNNAKSMSSLSLASDKKVIRIGRPSIVERLVTNKIRRDSNKLLLSRKQSLTLPNCSASIVNDLVPTDYESIGRIIRQTNAELTVRNAPFHHYLFDNNLYNSDGVLDVFDRNSKNLNTSNAPYHRINKSSNTSEPAAILTKIDLPSNSVMIKSNWMHKDLAKKLKMTNDESNPYITKHMATQIKDPKTNENCLWHGEHYLIAFHISSKDIPQWVWTTFEHVNLPGRCDITGCNDSFGFKSSDKLPKDVFDNYVAPKVKSDNLSSASTVFDRNKRYKPEKIKTQLANIFQLANIGSGKSTSKHEPDPQDKAWLSYRLKGSQIDFTDHTGRPTYLGNSVTEAGFMDGSSCVSCHSRAGIGISNKKADFFKLSVFNQTVTDYGYAKSVNGIPNPNWFNESDTPPKLNVLQTDFIWGFLFAKPLPIKK